MDIPHENEYALGLLDALMRAAEDYEHGGFNAVALRLNKSPRVLRNELQGREGSKAGAMDMVRIYNMTRSPLITAALGTEMGGMWTPLAGSVAADGCALQAIANLSREMGEYMAQVAESLADGVISDNELRRCEKELTEHIAAAHKLQMLLRERNQASKPAHERRQVQRRASDRGQ